MPGLAVDEMAVVEGPQLASSDSWRVTFRGVGTHGAKPHLGKDPITAAGDVPLGAADHPRPRGRSAAAGRGQRLLAARRRPAARSTSFPTSSRSAARRAAYTPDVRDQLEAEIGRLARGTAAMFGIDGRLRVRPPHSAGGQRCRCHGAGAGARPRAVVRRQGADPLPALDGRRRFRLLRRRGARLLRLARQRPGGRRRAASQHRLRFQRCGHRLRRRVLDEAGRAGAAAPTALRHPPAPGSPAACRSPRRQCRDRSGAGRHCRQASRRSRP